MHKVPPGRDVPEIGPFLPEISIPFLKLAPTLNYHLRSFTQLTNLSVVVEAIASVH